MGTQHELEENNPDVDEIIKNSLAEYEELTDEERSLLEIAGRLYFAWLDKFVGGNSDEEIE